MEVSVFLKICGIGILASVCVLILGHGTSSTYVRIGGGVVIFASSALLLSDAVSALSSIAAQAGGTTQTEEIFSLMLRALGISVIGRLCSNICRDCGEGTLAQGIEGAANTVILLMSLPLLSDIVEYARRVLEMGQS